MSRYDTGTHDHRVRVRPPKSSRPRTKRRPDYSDRPLGRVVAVDRGRFTIALNADTSPSTDEVGAKDFGTLLTAVKARELPRSSVVIGDLVRLTGDLSGRPDTLARIVTVQPRSNVLRRSLEEAPESRGEKIIVANADLLVIVTATADPLPRVGMVDRCLVAAHEAGIPAVICMTKTDLGSPRDFLQQFSGFGVEAIETSVTETADAGLKLLRDLLADRFSVMVGHSGVGKSTLINALEPTAKRQVGEVSSLTGKGRHTSTSAVAVPLEGGGWLVDTPGVRSFGLAHVEVADVLATYPGVGEAAENCMPNCTHSASEDSCYLDVWAGEVQPESTQVQNSELVGRARTLLTALNSVPN